ncbi:hypothetical protein JTE90_014464 [Oedothorax gibbosus]|uniref:Uncharacterized protein n=1 Tax=Oedothorax gibbosus TaxID=931172 RepID=A0AAV6VLW5_9ARAC|nr:hypothetical protein JTE90_014464 [Oedothorax gibbosus]
MRSAPNKWPNARFPLITQIATFSRPSHQMLVCHIQGSFGVLNSPTTSRKAPDQEPKVSNLLPRVEAHNQWPVCQRTLRKGLEGL